MAKHILNTSDNDLNFRLIGIVCQENQYLVASLVNDNLNINLFLSDYIPFSLKEGRLFKFSLFRFMDEELGIEYFFVPNNSNFEQPQNNIAVNSDLFSGLDVDEHVKLVKELPKTDYFLILKGEEVSLYYHKVLDKLKSIPAVIQVQAIEPASLPSRRNLIF